MSVCSVCCGPRVVFLSPNVHHLRVRNRPPLQTFIAALCVIHFNKTMKFPFLYGLCRTIHMCQAQFIYFSCAKSLRCSLNNTLNTICKYLNKYAKVVLKLFSQINTLGSSWPEKSDLNRVTPNSSLTQYCIRNLIHSLCSCRKTDAKIQTTI